MNRRIIFLILACLFVFLSWNVTEAKKIKNSFRIEKTSKNRKHNKEEITGKEISLADSLENLTGTKEEELEALKNVSYAGYDKEPNSRKESFILVNNSPYGITGFRVRIDYLDMKERMLHSREIEMATFVPAGESRHFDIDSWDKQNTYYYHLGNEPKKVATPFNVRFIPLTFWIEE